MKKLYIFDLDGTLSPSKSPVEAETAALVCKLLGKTKMAIVTGSGYATVADRFLKGLSCGANVYPNLYLLPTNGAMFYAFTDGEFKPVYENPLNDAEKEQIFDAFNEAVAESGFEMPAHMYGTQLEDRRTQMTFSALGQDAPLSEKQTWDPDQSKRRKLLAAVQPKLTDFQIRIGGTTSLDVTRKGIDKAFAIRQVLQHLMLPVSDATFIGDALYEGGNDSAAIETGIETIAVTGPKDTRLFIERVLSEGTA